MKDKLYNLLSNGSNLNIGDNVPYAGMIGFTPSQGARSPKLWNASFKGLGVKAEMYPMDIVDEDTLSRVISVLKHDEYFIGGAVNMPYKQHIIKYLDALEEEAEIIGAVNCVYRKDGRLIGSNTDGAGAIESLKNTFSDFSLKGKKVLAIGVGGAGMAVMTYLAREIGRDGTLIISNRSIQVAEEFAKKLRSFCENIRVIPVANIANHVDELALLVNCSSVGFESVQRDDKGLYSLEPYTPLGLIDGTLRVTGEDVTRMTIMSHIKDDVLHNLNESIDVLLKLPEDVVVFDIIYQPEHTQLLHLASLCGLRTIGGLGMNLEQAVVGFYKAVSFSGLANHNKIHIPTIRNLMSNT